MAGKESLDIILRSLEQSELVNLYRRIALSLGYYKNRSLKLVGIYQALRLFVELDNTHRGLRLS